MRFIWMCKHFSRSQNNHKTKHRVCYIKMLNRTTRLEYEETVLDRLLFCRKILTRSNHFQIYYKSTILDFHKSTLKYNCCHLNWSAFSCISISSTEFVFQFARLRCKFLVEVYWNFYIYISFYPLFWFPYVEKRFFVRSVWM